MGINNLKSLPVNLLALDKIPQFSAMPPFPIKAFANTIQQRLQIDHFHIEKKQEQWVEHQKGMEGFETDALRFTLTFPPLEGSATLLLAKKEIELLMRNSLKIEPPFIEQFFTPYLHFLTLVGCDAFSLCGFPLKTVPQILKEAPLPLTDFYRITLHIEHNQNTSVAALLIDTKLMEEIRQYFPTKEEDTLSFGNVEKTPLFVSCIGASMELTQDEIQQIEVGDLLIFDSSITNPLVSITLEGYPLFHGKLENGTVTIQEQDKKKR